jgi:WD40 repeat protein/tetratricopeptide (TPR) repeat protein
VDPADLLDRACLELAGCWREGLRVPVETYLARHPALAADPEAVLDLIECELTLRAERGEAPDPAEYLARFPGLAGPLGRRFALERLVEEQATPDPTLGSTLDAGPDDPPRPDAGRWPALDGLVIQGELGRGGMGIVYRAHQLGLGRTVAVKTLLVGGAAGPDALARFRAEAEAIARLRHPNVVQVYSVGPRDGPPYLVMEYVPGGSLAERLDGSPQPPREAAELVEALACGLAEAHRLGVIHRDVKPANILLDGRTPKLADFGLAKLLDGDSDLTRTGTLLGSPTYMAPEQVGGPPGRVGPPADVHALGVLLYELLTGRPPFRGATMAQTLDQVKEAEPVPPSRLVPGLPRDLETVCLACLRKEPERRYPSAAALEDDLRRYLAGEPIRARRVGWLGRARRWSRRHPEVAGLLVTLAACLAIGYAAITRLWLAAAQSAQLARNNEARARELAGREATIRSASERQIAALALERGQDLATAGLVGRGLLWMAEAHRLAPPGAGDVRRAARAGLAAWAAVAPRPASIRPHAQRIAAVDVGPDDRTALVLDYNGAIALHDLTGDRPTRRLPAIGGGVQLGAFGPDGRTALVANFDQRAVRLVDLERGDVRREFRMEGAQARIGRFVLGGRRVALVDPYAARLDLVDAGTGAGAVPPRTFLGRLELLDVGPDGRLLAVGVRGRAWLIDAETGAFVGPELDLEGPAMGLVFAPDGRRYAAWGWDRTARRGTLRIGSADGASVGPLPLAVEAVAWRPDGRVLAVGGCDGSLRLIDASDGSALGPAIEFDVPLTGLSDLALTDPGCRPDFSPDGTALLTGHVDGTVRLWDLASNRPLRAVLEHAGRLAGYRFLGDGRTVVTAGADGALRTWDVAAPLAPGRALSGRAGVRVADLGPDGRTLAVADLDDAALLIDLPTGEPLGPPMRHDRRSAPGAGAWSPLIRAVAFGPDGSRVVTVGDDRTARLWDAATGAPAAPPMPHPHWVLSARFTPDGTTLLTGNASIRARRWDVATGRQLGPDLVLPDGQEVALTAATATGEVVGVGARGVLAFWEPTSGRLIRAIKPFDGGGILKIWVAPDGRTLLLHSNDGRARVLDAATRAPRGPAFGRGFRVAVPGRDGRLLLAGDDARSARLWDVATGRPASPPLDHPANVTAVAFLPGEEVLVTGSDDGLIRTWDAGTGLPAGPPLRLGDPVEQVLVPPDGTSLVGVGGVVASWRRPAPLPDDPARVAALARALAGRRLDADGQTSALAADAWAADAALAGLDGLAADPADWHESMAARSERDGLDAAALWHLDRRIALRPDDWFSHARRAEVRSRLGDAAGAEADRAAAESLGPRARTLAWLDHEALAAERQGRWDEAAPALDRLVAAGPDGIDLRLRRGEALARLGRWARAADDLARAVAARPGELPLVHRLALLRLRAGDREGFRAAARAALSMVPPGAAPSPAQANLTAWIVALGPADRESGRAAVRLAERALAAMPDEAGRAAVLNTLGTTLYRAGEPERAVAAITRGMAGTGGLAHDWAVLALAHQALGHRDQALAALARLDAIRTAPDLDSFWDALELECLRREAEAVVRLDPAMPADPFARD